MKSTPADQTVLANTASTARFVWTDQDGEPLAAASNPTYVVSSSDGTELASGESGAVGGGIYEAPLGPVTNPDRLAVTWTVGAITRSSTVDVAGGTYFTVAEARAADSSLTDVAKYPAADIIARRRGVEREIEDAAGVAFVPRFSIVEARGNGTTSVMLPTFKTRSVRWAREITSLGTSITLAVRQVAESGLVTFLTAPATDSRVVVGVEHGHDMPPAGLPEQAIVLLRTRLNQKNSAVPSRAERYQPTDGGVTYFLSMPGARKIGIPDLDALIERHGVRLDGIA